MTNSNSSGGTTLVNPGADGKHSLNEAMASSSAEEEKVEGLLINEEENMMTHDEEITSEEETDPDAVERKMLTVALVKSVVETKQDSEGDEKRYGLRKRRRPTGEDLRLLEHNQSSTDGGLARKTQLSATEAMVNDPLSPQGNTDDPMETKIPEEKPNVLFPDTGPVVDATTPGAPLLAPSVAAVRETSELKAPVAEPSQLPNDSKPSAKIHVKTEPLKPPAAQLRKPAAKPAAKVKAESPVNVPIISASSTVPNPLSAIPIQASTMSMHSSKAAHADSTLAAVPCPLPAAALEEKEEPHAATLESADKRKVTINEPIGRPRAFSIDLDLGQFDITGDGGGDGGDGDLPLGGGGRNRAFSFECFAFGINADEPLPPLGSHDVDSVSTGRPRGDSIIFDPSSFQEGGIHEQNALEKARLNENHEEVEQTLPPPEPVVAADVPVSQAVAVPAAPAPPVHPGEAIKSNLVAAPRSNTAAAAKPTLPPAPVTSYTTTTTTATHTTTTTTLLPSAAAAATTTTFSMDLLNKDGRIGIYLPEARKARIARFHEKRARRIWRKRIKYDCRKKLADSRPRIKGRFVKRSDMEDE